MYGHSCTKCSAALWKKYKSNGISVIPDIKCKSPAEGILISGGEPSALAGELVRAGAPMISVVTEKNHYGGSARLLERIAGEVSVPVLRKDFITCGDQIRETADLGASGVLLIAAMMDKRRLSEMVEESLKLGLEPLVETHTLEEIRMLEELELSLIGINNRNILELETDSGTVDTTERLIPYLRGDALIVSESSISCTGDIRRAAEAGAHAVLTGTAILRSPDPVQMYRMLSGAVERSDNDGCV